MANPSKDIDVLKYSESLKNYLRSQEIFCVYLTIYKGNKLPPFYIGSTNIKKIEDGYKGSVSSKEFKKIWLDELKSSPELFSLTILSKHVSRKEALLEEFKLHKKCNVLHNELYINKATCRGSHLSYIWNEEAKKKHSIKRKSLKIKRPDVSEHNKNWIRSEETKRKMSEAKKEKYKGQGNPRFGKTWTKEDRLKNSLSQSPYPLLQYDLKGNLIRKWDSIYQAASILDYNRNSLATIAYANKKYKGHIWKVLRNNNDN